MILPVVAARLGCPQAPDREPQRINTADADHPEGSGEVACQHVCRVVDAEVEPGKADQEYHEHPGDSNSPPRYSPQPVGQDEREHPVEPDGDGGVPTREGIEGGLIPGVEELGTRPLEDGFENGCEQDTPRGRDDEEYGGEFPASAVEEEDH